MDSLLLSILVTYLVTRDAVMRLTKTAIEGFKYQGKVRRKRGQVFYDRDVRWDDKTAGFGVRVYPPNADGKSKKSFVLSYRHEGVKRLMVIGQFGRELTLDTARKKALKYLAGIDEADPLEESREARRKDGRTHFVPLTAPVVALLQDLPRLENNPHVFPGQRRGKHLTNISLAWLRIRKAAGVEDVRLHDLRRTVGSWLAQSGATLHLVGKVLGHSKPSTTAIYAHFSDDHVREALDRHAAQVIAAARRKKPADMHSIKEVGVA